VLKERATRRGKIACPRLGSVSFAASFLAPRRRPTIRIDLRGRERESKELEGSFPKASETISPQGTIKDEKEKRGRKSTH